MSRLKPYWKNEKFWVCPHHLPSAKIPSQVSTCYFSNCNSVRPSTESAPHLKFKVVRTLSVVPQADKNKGVIYCSLSSCDNVIEHDSKRKKYCSDYCRKKYARTQYNNRMKEKKKQQVKAK